MNLSKFSQAKSEFFNIVQLVRNHIAEEHFISYFILSVSNSHERLGETMPKCGTDLTSNAKYGDTLHLDASMQWLHLPNYILPRTDQSASCISRSKAVRSIFSKF